MRPQPSVRWWWGLMGLGLLAGLLVVDVAWARAHPGGADFWPLWRGTRAWLLHGHNPYEPQPGGPTPPWAAGQTFDIPLYAAVVVAPYALVPDYPLARALWMATTQMALVLTALLAIRAWRGPSGVRRLWVLAAVLAGPWGVEAMLRGRFEAVLLPLAVLAAAGWRTGRVWGPALAALGLLARPVFFGPWLLAWISWLVARPRGRRALAAWLLLTAAILFATRLLLPGWGVAYLEAWAREHWLGWLQGWGAPAALAQALPGVGAKLGLAFALLSGGWWVTELAAAWGKSWLHGVWVAALGLVLAPWWGVPLAPGVTALSLPLAGPFVWALWDQRWLYGKTAVVGSALGLVALGWLLAHPLQAGALIGPGLGYGLLPALLVFGLYFVRWWATHADWWAAA